MKKQSAVKGLFIITKLEENARRNATREHTGRATAYRVTVRYYPVSRRYAWFDETGPITKRLAVKILENLGK